MTASATAVAEPAATTTAAKTGKPGEKHEVIHDTLPPAGVTAVEPTKTAATVKTAKPPAAPPGEKDHGF